MIVYRDQNFGQGRKTGRGFRVSHVGLGGSDEERGGSAVATEDFGHAVCLLRVARGSSGAMEFDVRDGAWINAGL